MAGNRENEFYAEFKFTYEKLIKSDYFFNHFRAGQRFDNLIETFGELGFLDSPQLKYTPLKRKSSITVVLQNLVRTLLLTYGFFSRA